MDTRFRVPSGFFKGLAMNPKGWSFLHAFRSSESLAWAMPLMFPVIWNLRGSCQAVRIIGLIYTGENRSNLDWVTRPLEKKSPNFQRIAPKVAKSKKAKISTTKLNLKVQNIYMEPLLKP
jgi:hypothetical protein